MKKIAFLCILGFGLVSAQTKKVVKSDVRWWGYKIAKTETSSHTGTVDIKEGTVVLKKGQFAGGTFVFDMNTINSTDLSGEWQAKLNQHLKNGDFFEVDKYPKGIFKITGLKKNSGKYNYIVIGDLTLKNKTNKIAILANIKIENNQVIFNSDKISLDRQKWGVAYKSTLQDIVIKDDMDLQVNFTAQ